jgi:hypothetical protein
VEAIGTVGAMYDLPETLAWSRELNNEEIRQQAMIAMAGRSQANDPAITSEIISEIAPGVRRNQLIKGLVKEIQDDPERAFQWTSVVDAPELRNHLCSVGGRAHALPFLISRTKILGSVKTQTLCDLRDGQITRPQESVHLFHPNLLDHLVRGSDEDVA